MSTSRRYKPKSKRRRYTKEFRLSVLKELGAACNAIFELASKHQLNANLVHRWCRDQQRGQVRQREGFVALSIPVTPRRSIGCQRIDQS